MNIKDTCYPINTERMKIAERVQWVEESGRCSEETAALVMIAEQLTELVQVQKQNAEQLDQICKFLKGTYLVK